MGAFINILARRDKPRIEHTILSQQTQKRAYLLHFFLNYGISTESDFSILVGILYAKQYLVPLECNSNIKQ